jgi:hypothetical protein
VEFHNWDSLGPSPSNHSEIWCTVSINGGPVEKKEKINKNKIVNEGVKSKLFINRKSM